MIPNSVGGISVVQEQLSSQALIDAVMPFAEALQHPWLLLYLSCAFFFALLWVDLLDSAARWQAEIVLNEPGGAPLQFDAPLDLSLARVLEFTKLHA